VFNKGGEGGFCFWAYSCVRGGVCEDWGRLSSIKFSSGQSRPKESSDRGKVGNMTLEGECPKKEENQILVVEALGNGGDLARGSLSYFAEGNFSSKGR